MYNIQFIQVLILHKVKRKIQSFVIEKVIFSSKYKDITYACNFLNHRCEFFFISLCSTGPHKQQQQDDLNKLFQRVTVLASFLKAPFSFFNILINHRSFKVNII